MLRSEVCSTKWWCQLHAHNISDTAKLSILRLKKHELALEKEIDVIKQLAKQGKKKG